MVKSKKTQNGESPKTRQRILQTALELFNEQGERNVTTAQIARSLNMSEGNLWYHFRTKQDIVWELFTIHESEIDANLAPLPQETMSVEEYLHYTTRSFYFLWEYRFLYRDRYETPANVDFHRRLQDLIRRGQQKIEAILSGMRQSGKLSATDEEIHALAVNAWIIHSRWLNYIQSRDSISEITEAHIKEGFAQMLALYNPYFSVETRAAAKKLLAEFSLLHEKGKS